VPAVKQCSQAVHKLITSLYSRRDRLLGMLIDQQSPTRTASKEQSRWEVTSRSSSQEIHRKFRFVFTKSCQWSASWCRWILFTSLYPLSSTSTSEVIQTYYSACLRLTAINSSQIRGPIEIGTVIENAAAMQIGDTLPVFATVPFSLSERLWGSISILPEGHRQFFLLDEEVGTRSWSLTLRPDQSRFSN
jgi:hypothetical protein